jgi:hypothetical protein
LLTLTFDHNFAAPATNLEQLHPRKLWKIKKLQNYCPPIKEEVADKTPTVNSESNPYTICFIDLPIEEQYAELLSNEPVTDPESTLQQEYKYKKL